MSVVDPGSDTEHHRHHQTGHRWLDITLAVSAVAISLTSLFLALQHGRVMERMVEANTWPYVIVGVSTSREDGTPHVTLWMVNKGVGPAKIESVEVFYEARAMGDAQGLLKAILVPPDPNRHFVLLRSDVISTVLSARETVNLVDLDVKNYSEDEYSRVGAAFTKLEFRACYCSVFDECSVLDTRKAARRPFPVKTCAVPDRMFGQ
jgi:hypothetical protein